MKPENPKASLRCAVYTRVSTEHGLEQEFNALDNQREASEAYVKCKIASNNDPTDVVCQRPSLWPRSAGKG
jgi:hypothetical protein